MPLDIKSQFDPATKTVSYVLIDPETRHAAIIDSVLDFDAKAGRTSTASAEKLIETVQNAGATVDYILDTHVHADHMTAAQFLKSELGGAVCIGNQVGKVQKTFAHIFNLGPDFPTDGSQFDRLLADGEKLSLGEYEIEVLSVPGHTPACSAYKVEDAIFTGDTIFMPDFGSARCDFPNGDARTLYKSVRRLLSYPDDTRLFLCHDYGPGGRDFIWETTVAQQNAENIHINATVDEEAFVKFRTERDATLNAPDLILPSVQVNIRAGHLPEPEANGIAYLKIPLNGL